MALFIESFWQVLGESDPLRRGTLLVAAFVVAGVGATAIGLLSRHLVRRLRGLSAVPIRRFGQDEASLLEAGWAQHKSNCTEKAIAQFDQALALNPHSLEALKGRGICYSEIGEYDLAMQDFHMWVLRAPESGDAFFHRGSMWRKLDLVGLAISDYRYALRFSPSNKAARDALIELMPNSTADRPKSISSLARIFESQSLHYHALAEVHGGTDAHSQHMRDGSQDRNSSPSPDEDIAVSRELENFFGRVLRQLLLVDLPPFK